MSIAGGLPLAVDRAVAAGCTALQIFTKSVGQWRARPLPPEEVRAFRQKVRTGRLARVIAHDSYLINVAAREPALRQRSIAALAEELERAESLGLDGLVMHPGAYTSGTEDEGLDLIAEALDTVLASRSRRRTRLLLEHTAGQGTSLGHRFEHLAIILRRMKHRRRVGVCLDTCHLLAAGYDIRSEKAFRRTMAEFDRVVGLGRLEAVHLNDSKKPLGSRVDRHAHIGQGDVGLAAFRVLMNDPRFRTLPMILETPKSRASWGRGIEVDPDDERNLMVLRGL